MGANHHLLDGNRPHNSLYVISGQGVLAGRVTYGGARAALGEAVNAPYPQAGDRLVLGQVTWRKPPAPVAGLALCSSISGPI
jgi:hypothetical protein